jgi:hypothetical protein
VDGLCLYNVISSRTRDELSRLQRSRDEDRKDRFYRSRLSERKRSEADSPITLRSHLQRGNEVRKKAYWVVVAFVQRDPGERPFATQVEHSPLAQEEVLPKPAGGDERQLAPQPHFKPFTQARTWDKVGVRCGM